MGISLNEILPFLLGDGNISGIPNLNKSEMMASLGIFETHGENSETHNFGTHEMTKSERRQNPRFLSTENTLHNSHPPFIIRYLTPT